MATFNATNLIFKFGGSAVAMARTGEITFEQDTPDATTKDSGGWADNIGGLRRFSGTCDGVVDYTSSAAGEFALSSIIARDTLSVQFSTTTGGDMKITGTCRITSFSQSAPMEDVPTYSFAFVGKGTPTKGTV